MHTAKKQKNNLLFVTGFISALLLLLGAVVFNAPSAYAADPQIKSGGCVGEFSVGYSSPFTKTKDMCLGDDAGAGLRFFQFAVKLPSAASGVTVKAKSGNGTTINFVKESDTLYVSQPGSNYEGMGYGVPVVSSCNKDDKANSIVISVTGGGSQPDITLNLCSYNSAAKSLVYSTATAVVGDNGEAPKVGTIEANLGVIREGAPDNYSERLGLLEKDGIASISLSGKASKSGDNQSDWYSFPSSGKLNIGNLDPGTYNLAITYNDCAQIEQENPPGQAEWTNCEIKIDIKNIVVVAGKVTAWPADGSVQYYDGEGTATAVSGTTQEDDTTSCTIDGIGWMVCPLMNALGGFNDLMYGWIEGILVLNPLQMNDPAGEPTPQYQNWQVMRDIANVLLVIVFLIVIFSQATSFGISNYGVKKMLPRIVMIAIAINISYFIMMLAVDLVNLIGVGLNNILNSTAVSANAENLDFENVIGSLLTGTVITVGGFALAGVAAGGFGALALIALPFVVVAGLALLAAVATLFLRNALVIVLVVIAPLALVAYLLPNTENLFDKWRKLFISMLMLFPMAALLFGGAKFAAYIILTSNEELSIIAALFIMAAPLGALPWLLSQSNSILAGVNNRLQGLAKSAKSPLQNALKPAVSARQERYRSGAANVFGRGRGTVGEDGIRRDANGREMRRTIGQRFGDDKRTLENEAEGYKHDAADEYRERSLTRNDRGSLRARHALDHKETAKIRSAANDAAFQERLDERIGTAGSIEQAYSSRASDLSRSSATYQSIEKQRQAERVQRNEASTALQAPGSGPARRLGDMSRQQYAADEATKTAESKVLEANMKSGVASRSIQERKASELGIERVNAQEDATFSVARNTQAPLIAETELLDAAKINSNEQAAIEKARLDQTAQLDPALVASRQRRENAEARSAGIASDIATELKERTVTDAELANLDLNRRANDKAGKTAEDESLKMYAEAVTTDGSTTQIRAAGTINPTEGAAKAAAYGIDAKEALRSENVKAYTTRLKEAGTPDSRAATLGRPDAAGDDSLLGIALDHNNRTDEEREAAGRKIVNDGNIDAIEPYMHYLASEYDDAQAALETAQRSGSAADIAAAQKRVAVNADLQKAFSETIGSSPGKPFGLGAGEIAALRSGTYGRETAGASVPSPVDTSGLDIPALQTLSTVINKGVSVDKLQTMDKTDVKILTGLVTSGLVPPGRQEDLWESLDSALSDPRVYRAIQPRERKMLEDLFLNSGLAVPTDPVTGRPKPRTPVRK